MGNKKSKQDKSLKALRKPRRQAQGKGKILAIETMEKIERRYQVMQLRRDGYTVVEISKTLGCTPATVHKDLEECLTQVVTDLSETTEHQRQIAIQRLDNLVKAFTPTATTTTNRVHIDKRSGEETIITVPPDPAAAAILLQIEARRAKLMALDVPEPKRLEETGIRIYVGIDVDQV